MYQTMSRLCEITAQINLQSNSFILLQAPENVQEFARHGMTVDDVVRKISEKLVSDPYKDNVYAFLDRSTMAERLENDAAPEQVYLDRYGVWHQLILLPRTFEDGALTSVIVVSRNVSAQKQREIAY